MADLPYPAGPADSAVRSPLPALPPPLRRGRLGWCGHLFFLTAWLLALTFLGYYQTGPSGNPHVPSGSAKSVLLGVGTNALVFGVICAAAWWCSRATAAEWRMRWRGGPGPVWRGVLYSVALRIFVLVLIAPIVFALVYFHVIDEHDIAQFRPRVENALSLPALAHDRAYYWCVVTLLCASAGILEEMWRGGMLAGLARVFPRVFGGPVGSWMAIVPVAVLFGLGHLYMGWGAVAGAVVLGLALGAITVWHRTVWDAVITHALFDASTVVVLAWAFQKNPHLFGQ